MTPKEKAIYLVETFKNVRTPIRKGSELCAYMSKDMAVQCALLAVDEIDESIDFDWMEVQNLESEHRFWDEVKHEIELL